MTKEEFDSLPITHGAIFDPTQFRDSDGYRWFVGSVDGVVYKRRIGGDFNSATFDVRCKGQVRRVCIPFLGDYTERVLRAAINWGANEFNCPIEELDSVALS